MRMHCCGNVGQEFANSVNLRLTGADSGTAGATFARRTVTRVRSSARVNTPPPVIQLGLVVYGVTEIVAVGCP